VFEYFISHISVEVFFFWL